MKISRITLVIVSILILYFMLFSSGCSCFADDTPEKIETVITQKKADAIVYEKNKMGVPVAYSDIVITVNKTRPGKVDTYSQPAIGYEYILVSTTIENPTEEDKDSSDIPKSFIEDDQNYQFKYISTTKGQDGNIIIPAGGKVTVDICYEVPKNKKGLTLVFYGYSNPKEIHFALN